MFATAEFNPLTAVIPVLSPSKFLQELLSLQDKTKKLGIQLIFIVDETPETQIEDEAAVNIIRSKDRLLTKVFSGTYGSPGAARNAAIPHISSEWVTFWDADDFLWPDKYLLAVKKYPNVDLIVGGFQQRTGNKFSIIMTKNLTELAYRPGIWRIIFKSETFKSCKFPDLSMGEDQLLLMELKLESKNMVYVEDVFYEYNLAVAGQLTKSVSALKDLRFSVRIARRFAKSERNQRYAQIIALRLFLTLLKQTFIPVSEKLSECKNYIRPRYVRALVSIIKQRLIGNA